MAVTLPDGVELVNPPASCTATATGFTCPVSNLRPGGEITLPFEVITHSPVTDASISAEVTWDADGIPSGASGVETFIKLSTALPGATSVPTLTDLTLALLALLLAAGAAKKWRRKG